MSENTSSRTPFWAKTKVPADATGRLVSDWDDITPPEFFTEWARDASADEPGGRRAVTDDDGVIVRDDTGQPVYELSGEEERRLAAEAGPEPLWHDTTTVSADPARETHDDLTSSEDEDGAGGFARMPRPELAPIRVHDDLGWDDGDDLT